MKRTKFFAMLLACLMVVALVPVVAAPAAAAEKVVYVGNDAKGDGSAPDKALASLADAFAAIGDEDGVIVLIEEYEYFEGVDVPEHKGHITITGKYNGVDYKGGIYCANTNQDGHLRLGGDTTFENLVLWVTNTWVIRARFHHLTMGEGVTTRSDNPAHDETYPRIYLVGGDQGSGSTYDTSKDTHLTIKSGTFYEVMAGPRSGAPSDYTGKAVFEMTGDAKVYKLALTGRSTATVNYGSGLMVLDGGSIACWATAHDSKATGCLGDVQIVLTKNFDYTKSFNDNNGERILTDGSGNQIFYGISGSSVFVGYEAATLFAKSELLIDPSIKAAIEAAGVINPAGFTEVKEYVYTGTIGSGTLGDAPAADTTAAVTTAADTTAAVVDTTAAVVDTTAAVADTTEATGQVTPPTGDNSAVLFAVSAAALVAVAAMVFFKKRVTE